MQRRQLINTVGGGADTLGSLLPRGAFAVLLSIACMLEVGFDEPPLSAAWFTAIKSALLLGLWGAHGAFWMLQKTRLEWIKQHTIELALLIAASIFLFSHWAWSMGLIALLVIYILAQAYLALAQLVIRFSLLFVGSFALLIFIGALLLMLPRATPPDHPINFLDAVFTSTSAVCVTGLIVRDTATEFTRFGQTIILILIQLGGLGIIIFGALLATMLSGSMSVRHASNIQEVVSTVEGGPGNVERLVRFIVAATLLTEAAGAALLYFGWRPFVGDGFIDPERHGFNSIFISISAFCNAGFSIYSDSLESFRYHWTSHAVVAPLIVCGGLGFPVLYNLWQVWSARLRLRLGRSTARRMHHERLIRLNLHTKVVLIATGAIYLLGMLALLGGQLGPHAASSLASEQVQDVEPVPTGSIGQFSTQVLDASFMSITARTCGFNTVPMNELTLSSQYVLMLLMWIGGSPGSMAGGVRTTVLALLILSVISTLRKRESTEVLGRSIPEGLIQRAGALVLLSFSAIAGTVFVLTVTESSDFALQVFEAVSAFGTVGLSMGLTPDLSDPGRVVIIMAMFLGRVGPLALLGAVVIGRVERSRYHYPAEVVILG